MAKQAQGVIIQRESSVAGSTVNMGPTNSIGFDAGSKQIRREAGFAPFSTGMVIECDASLNDGAYTIAATGATYIAVYETLVDQASGANVSITGHAMQTIGEIVSFNGPSMSANVIDITNLASTAKEKKIGVVDAGNLAISVNMDATGSLHKELEADMAARTARKFHIKLTDVGTSQPTRLYFGGYVSGFNVTGAVDNAIKADLTIAISSGVKWMEQV